MCWNKESSLLGFVFNILGIYLHINSPSSKFIPLFITVALTQLFDFLFYIGYNKYFLGELLKITLISQLYFIKTALNLPNIYILFIVIQIFNSIGWNPYDGVDIKGWNEHKYSTYYLVLVWIIVPMLLIYHRKNYRDMLVLLSSFILLFMGSLYSIGTVGKNWCINGVLLNFITKFIYSI